MVAAMQGLSFKSATDGVSVVDLVGTGLGRVVVALRRFEQGEVVMAESAALVYSGEFGLVRAFTRASDATKEAVMDMFYPPLNSSMASQSLAASGYARGDSPLQQSTLPYLNMVHCEEQLLKALDPDFLP